MATVNCPGCGVAFDPTNYIVQGGGAAAGAATGAWLGSMVGIALGPLGAIAGTIPGAILGAGGVYLGLSKVARCPRCSKTFLI